MKDYLWQRFWYKRGDNPTIINGFLNLWGKYKSSFMKLHNRILFITAFLLFGTNWILACDCRSLGTLAEELTDTTAVFSGKVIVLKYQKITDASDSDFGMDVLMVKIKVDRWWKGSGKSEVVMRTGTAKVSGGTRRESCDFSFKPEEDYLVFANSYKDWLNTNHCTRTKYLSNADENLKELGKGFLPNILNEQNDEAIQGKWNLTGTLPPNNSGHPFTWFLEWTFSEGSFQLTGYPPLSQKGKYRILKQEDNKLTLELYDQSGNLGTKDKQIVIDKENQLLKIDGKEGFKQVKKKE